MLNDEIEEKSIKKYKKSNNLSQLKLICQTHNLVDVTVITL
jgi:hypothetical protein